MEYAKKTPFDKQINWASVSTEVADKALEIGQKRKDRKIALDQQMADYDLQLSNQKAFKTESLTSKWMDMADKSRDLVFQANKDLKSRKISESQYKKIVGNMSEYTKSVADTANSFDASIQEYIDRQVPDKDGKKLGGNYELEMLNKFGKLADFKNKNFSVLPDGRIAVDSVDENGVKTSTLDLMSLNKAENRYAPKNDIDAATSTVVKDWEQWTDFKDLGRGAWSSVEDMRQNPYIGPALYKAVKSINSTPKNTLSTLIDYSVIKEPLYAYNEAELKSVKDKAVADLVKMRQEMGVSTTVTAKDLTEIENRIIRVDPNTADPILTEAQTKLANETVEGLIQMKMGREEKGTAKQDWSKTPAADSGGYGQKDIDEAKEVYKLSKNAMIESVPGDNSNTNEYLSAIGQKMNKYVVKKKFSDGTFGLMIYDYVKSTDQYGNPVYTKAVDTKSGKPIRQGKSLAEYITGKPAGEANTIWELGKDNTIETTAVGNEGRTPYKPENKKPKAISQKDFNAKWANLKSGQTLVGPDGVTYTKK